MRIGVDEEDIVADVKQHRGDKPRPGFTRRCRQQEQAGRGDQRAEGGEQRDDAQPVAIDPHDGVPAGMQEGGDEDGEGDGKGQCRRVG